MTQQQGIHIMREMIRRRHKAIATEERQWVKWHAR